MESDGSEPFGGSLFGGLWTSFDVFGGLSTAWTALDGLDGPDGLERLLESPLAWCRHRNWNHSGRLVVSQQDFCEAPHEGV